MSLPWWFGLVLSALSALVRYRFPAMHPRLASAAIGACLVLAGLGFVSASPALAASLVLNGALIGFLADVKLSGARIVSREGATPAESASLTLDCRAGHDPKPVADDNIHAHYSTSMFLMHLTPRGPEKHLLRWIVTVWFRKPIFGYIASVDVVSGEATTATVLFQCSIGLVAAIEVPASAVVRIKAQKS